MAKQPVLTEYTITFDRLRQPFTVALVSDLHERNADDIAVLLEQAHPDLIAVAGDTFERFDYEATCRGYRKKYGMLRSVLVPFLSRINYTSLRLFCRHNLPDTANAYRFLERAAKTAPVYLSLGNHEDALSEEDIAFLRRNGITLLDNADTAVTIAGNHLRIGGLSSDEGTQWLTDFAHKDGFKLLLCHRPAYLDTVLRDKDDIRLILAGHVHGGQIRLFGRGLLSSGGRLFPKYHRGLYQGRMVVSAGCSNTVALPRWGNPRELVLVHLIPVKK